MFQKTKNSKSLLPSKDVSLKQLARISSHLDYEHMKTKYVNKEIKNQIQIGLKNDGAINRTIQNINSNGEELVRRYQQEKEKCDKLEFLVAHIEGEMYQAKMEQANDLKNNIEIDRLAQMNEMLMDKQKELEKVRQKTNTSSYDISKKVDNIRALRSERTIVSALFDKIERELCNLEHCYKVLVIQRKKQEDELERTIGKFNQCEISGEKEIFKIKQKCQRMRRNIKENIKINSINTQPDHKEDVCPLVYNDRFSLGQELKVINSQRKKSQRQKKEKTRKLEADLENINIQKTVKDILNSLGLSSVKELPSSIESLEAQNQQMLQQSNHLFEQIQKIQKNIQKLCSKKETNSLSGEKKAKLHEKKKFLLESTEKINKNRLQLSQFKQGCKIILSSVRESQSIIQEKPDFLNDKEEIVYLMGELEKFFEKSYSLEGSSILTKSRKVKVEPKRLTHLLGCQWEHIGTSIYEEKDLLEFARKNLDKTERMSSSRVEK